MSGMSSVVRGLNLSAVWLEAASRADVCVLVFSVMFLIIYKYVFDAMMDERCLKHWGLFTV